MNDTKKIGRPKKFYENNALMATVDVFLSKGYDGASIRDLTEVMGINGPSLYSTFGDKPNLYLKTIDRNATNDALAPLVAFESEPDIKTAVRSFMEVGIGLKELHKLLTSASLIGYHSQVPYFMCRLSSGSRFSPQSMLLTASGLLALSGVKEHALNVCYQAQFLTMVPTTIERKQTSANG